MNQPPYQQPPYQQPPYQQPPYQQPPYQQPPYQQPPYQQPPYQQPPTKKGYSSRGVIALVAAGVISVSVMVGGKVYVDAVQEKRWADQDAAQEKRVAEAAVAKEKREAELRNGVSQAATAYGAGLDAVEVLIARSKWAEADEKMKEVTAAVNEYRNLKPMPDEIAALVPRHDTLKPKLEAKRTEREIVAWIERAEAVSGDKAKCEDKSDVDAARKQVAGLQETDANYAKVQELNAKLDECLKNMPPPSEWVYNTRGDAMGGSVSTATVESSNSFKFDFPYQGEQHATLMVRNDKGTDVMLSIEQGQFLCDLGCSVDVRFDDGKTIRWRATGTSDHSTTTIFLRKEAAFIKALSKADVLRIETQFYQEGSRVLEFPVARFDASRLKSL